MGSSIDAYNNQRFFFDEQSPEIGGTKMNPIVLEQVSREQKETARKEAIQIIEDIMLDKTISTDIRERFIKLRALMCKI